MPKLCLSGRAFPSEDTLDRHPTYLVGWRVEEGSLRLSYLALPSFLQFHKTGFGLF